MKLNINYDTEKEGINFLRNVVEKNYCIFHEIDRDVDIGIDVQIELTRDGESTGKIIGSQVKSGKSYCTNNKCHITSDKKHFEYWKSYSLPVIIVVYDPNEKCAYWKSISDYLDENPHVVETGPYSISFEKLEYNKINLKYFKKYFIPLFLDAGIPASVNDSIFFAKSKDDSEQVFGFTSIYNHHLDKLKSYKFLLEYFKHSDTKTIPWYWVQVISLVFEADFFKNNPKLRNQIREFAQKELDIFSRKEIEVLLKLIERDNYESSDGENTIKIIGKIQNMLNILTEIIFDEKITYQIKRHALISLGYHIQDAIFPIFENTHIEKEFGDVFHDLHNNYN